MPKQDTPPDDEIKGEVGKHHSTTPAKTLKIKLVIDHSKGREATIHMFPNALILAFELLQMLPDMVCYTPALKYHGVCTDRELMDVTTEIRETLITNNFATAAHFVVFNADDGGIYIFMLQGASGPMVLQNETELIKPIIEGVVAPLVVIYNRNDFEVVYAAMEQKPQRVWPGQKDGMLQFFGLKRRRFVGATLDKTLKKTSRKRESKGADDCRPEHL